MTYNVKAKIYDPQQIASVDYVEKEMKWLSKCRKLVQKN